MIDAPRVRTLIVEDEPLARRTLRSIIGEVAWLECVGEAVDAEEAAVLIASLDPELIFLDVQLPGGSGIEVLERARSNAAVIFTTAFDTYALAAFELGAIDYVTKPFGPERIHRALGRAVIHVRAARDAARIGEASHALSVLSVAQRLEATLEATRAKSITTIFARDRGAIVPIPVSEIVRCEADGDFVAVYARGKRYLVYFNLGDLSGQLDAGSFLRVHRSHVVNLAAVDAIEALDATRVELVLRDGSRVPASRAGTRALRVRMRAGVLRPKRGSGV